MQTDSEGWVPRQSSQKESGRGLVNRARDAERRGDIGKSLGLYDDAIEALDDHAPGGRAIGGAEHGHRAGSEERREVDRAWRVWHC